MIPSLQPNRPRLPASSPHAPLIQQPARVLSATAVSPRTQIEAMPPQPRQLLPDHSLGNISYDSSVRHPVFFTEKLMRAPNVIMAENGDGSASSWGSPVAVGYIFNDGPKRGDGSRL